MAMMGGEQGAKRQKVSSEEVREFLAGAAPTLQPALAHCGGGEAEEEGCQWAAPIGDVAQLATALDGGQAASHLHQVAEKMEPWLPPLGSCEGRCLGRMS